MNQILDKINNAEYVYSTFTKWGPKGDCPWRADAAA